MTYLSIICSLQLEVNHLKSYPSYSKELDLNRVDDRFHESQNGIGYLVTHLDRVLYFLARASLLFDIPLSGIVRCKDKCLLFLVVITPHYKNGCLSLQEAGVVPACDVPGGPLEKYLQNNFTLEQIARLFCVSSKTSPTTYY